MIVKSLFSSLANLDNNVGDKKARTQL